uniref:Uncharacterized protein n=1 Tax=Lepeophtheirus salmonis TaxID=72036 RepID=A0A0K2UUI8_LEPSM
MEQLSSSSREMQGSAVHDIYTRFKKEERSPHIARSDRKVTPKFMAGLRRTATADPCLNQTTLPRRKGVARSSTIQKGL